MTVSPDGTSAWDGKFKSKRLVDEVAEEEATKLRLRFKKKVRKQIAGEKGKAKIVATATDADGRKRPTSSR